MQRSSNNNNLNKTSGQNSPKDSRRWNETGGSCLCCCSCCRSWNCGKARGWPQKG